VRSESLRVELQPAKTNAANTATMEIVTKSSTSVNAFRVLICFRGSMIIYEMCGTNNLLCMLSDALSGYLGTSVILRMKVSPNGFLKICKSGSIKVDASLRCAQRNRDVPGIESVMKSAGAIGCRCEEADGAVLFVEEELCPLQTPELGFLAVLEGDRS